MERLSLEKVFHPFIAGAHNRLVQELSQETGARISIPPPSLPKDEIVITGEKEAVALALNRIRAIYEDKVCLSDKFVQVFHFESDAPQCLYTHSPVLLSSNGVLFSATHSHHRCRRNYKR